MKNKDAQYLRKLPLKLLVLLILFLAVGYLCGIIVHELFGEQDDVLDKTTSGFIAKNIENDQLTRIMGTVTFFASAKFLTVAYILLVLWYWLIKRKNLFAIQIAAIAISSFLLTVFFKNIFQRVRPLDPLIEPLKNYSYPSGHASLGFIFYGLLAYLISGANIRRAYKYCIAGLFMLFSLLVGFSRIYLRIHHTSDVIAGFCQGLVWLSISIWFLERRSNR
ncbi:MAG TPA: phosphatase PAP2 family protein [Chitinophagaceae bacterium]|nr:phosphatase PAP2 family protein [Chitinophagaceae bacterium]